MSSLTTRDIAYTSGGVDMLGLLVTPAERRRSATVLLFHDAFGLGDLAIGWAREYARLGYTVFAADVWGGRRTAAGEHEVGPLIGDLMRDRVGWLGRAHAALAAAGAQDEVDPERIAAVGYCFGGSTALELLRTGGRMRAVVSVHGGLDLLARGWDESHRAGSVLVCTGSEDPMATAEQRDALTNDLDGAGIEWELDLYSGTRHAFTNPGARNSPNPEVVAYSARSAARAWHSTTRFLAETLAPERTSMNEQNTSEDPE